MKALIKSLSRAGLGIVLFGALSACGSSGIDQTGANNAALAVQNAQTQVQTKLAAGGGGGLTVTVNGANLTYGGTLTNSAGGSLSLTGMGTISAGSTSSTFNLTFTNWVDQGTGLTLNGSLTESATTTTTLPPSVTAKYSGNLVLSGSSTGTATYDLTISVSGGCASETGTIAGFTINVKAGAC